MIQVPLTAREVALGNVAGGFPRMGPLLTPIYIYMCDSPSPKDSPNETTTPPSPVENCSEQLLYTSEALHGQAPTLASQHRARLVLK